MILYEDKLWRPLGAQARPEKIYETLSKVVEGATHEWAQFYANPKLLNGLFCWTRYDDPWYVTAFVLRYGLGEDEASEPHTLAQIAERVGRPVARIGQVVLNFPLKLVVAHRLLQGAPQRLHYFNEFRPLGLSANTWYILAAFGRVYTVQQLLACSPRDLQGISRLGPEKVAEIRTCLNT